MVFCVAQRELKDEKARQRLSRVFMIYGERVLDA
jgi:hypothetical protein